MAKLIYSFIYGIIALLLLFNSVANSSIEIEKIFYTQVNYSGGVLSSWCTGCTLFNSLDHYSCSASDNNAGWNDGFGQFDDPIGPGYMLTDIAVNLTGTFHCLPGTSNASLQFTLSSVASDQFNIGPVTGYGCLCPNCAGSVEVPVSSFNKYPPSSQGWPNYNYSSSNRIQVSVMNHGTQDICLSSVNISLKTVLVFPTILQISPNLASKSSSSWINVTTNYLNPYQSYSCYFNGRFPGTSANVFNQTTLSCLTPSSYISPPNGQSDSLVIAPNWANPTRVYNMPKKFTFYSEPIIEGVSPPKGKPGEKITIRGEGFFESPYLTCIFGSQVSKAEFISENEVSCLVPQQMIKQENKVILTHQERTEEETRHEEESSLDFSRDSSFWSLKKSSNKVVVSVSQNGQSIAPSDFYFTIEHSQNWWTAQHIGIVVGSIAGGLLMLGIIIGVSIYFRNRGASSDPSKKPLLPYRSQQRSTNGHPSDDSSIQMSEIKLLEKVGRGSFGDIYRAEWRGTEVAIKKIPFNSLNDDLVEELMNEARIMESVRHPNVLSLMGCCTNPPEVCIIMEYMPRGSLYQILQDPRIPLSWQLIQRMALDTARGMNFLHQHNPIIMHRDLKTHNLLVDDAWRVKVADFGLSRMIEEKVSATMTICGTPCWTAPEVLRNQRYSVKADIYSFGVVMWELYTRTAPYSGMTPFQVMFGVASNHMRPPVDDDCPEPWKNLMVSCWSEDPDERPTFDQISKILQSMILPSS